MIGLVADAHRPPHDHKPIEGIGMGQGIAGIEVADVQLVTAGPGPMGNSRWPFKGDMLENADPHEVPLRVGFV
jgi:hypothetical protein